MNGLCMFTQIVFLMFEFYFMTKQGTDYLKNVWNIIDLTMFLVYCFYFFLRVFVGDHTIMPLHDKDMTTATELMFMWVILNSALLIQVVLKMLFFLRIFEKFG